MSASHLSHLLLHVTEKDLARDTKIGESASVLGKEEREASTCQQF